MKICSRPFCHGYRPGDAYDVAQCRTCWGIANISKVATFWSTRTFATVILRATKQRLFSARNPIVREFKCEHLGKRIELKVGCNGMYCDHACDKGLPAVPGEYCQTCKVYEQDPDNLPWV